MDGVVQYLGLKFENGDIKQQKIQKLRLIEPDHEELEVTERHLFIHIEFTFYGFSKNHS